MGKGAIYGKRKKQEKPKSFREETESSTGSTSSRVKEAIERYGDRTKTQGYDTGLTTTQRRKYERNRGK